MVTDLATLLPSICAVRMNDLADKRGITVRCVIPQMERAAIAKLPTAVMPLLRPPGTKEGDTPPWMASEEAKIRKVLTTGEVISIAVVRGVAIWGSRLRFKRLRIKNGSR